MNITPDLYANILYKLNNTSRQPTVEVKKYDLDFIRMNNRRLLDRSYDMALGTLQITFTKSVLC